MNRFTNVHTNFHNNAPIIGLDCYTKANSLIWISSDKNRTCRSEDGKSCPHRSTAQYASGICNIRLFMKNVVVHVPLMAADKRNSGCPTKTPTLEMKIEMTQTATVGCESAIHCTKTGAAIWSNLTLRPTGRHCKSPLPRVCAVPSAPAIF
jgi:hypothetical protein